MKIGDIYCLNYPFEEDISKSKERPAMILVVSKNQNDFYALKITSVKRNHYIHDVPIKDWKDAGLSSPSYVRCDKLQSFIKDDIVTSVGKNGYIGTMSLDDQKSIAIAFKEYAKEVDYISHNYDDKLNQQES